MSNSRRKLRRVQARQQSKQFMQSILAEQSSASGSMAAQFGAGGFGPERDVPVVSSLERSGEIPQMVGVSDDVVLARLAKTADIAKLLAVHPKTVERLRRTEKLPWIRISGSVRYDISDVLRWVSARKEGV
jgi:hypothetical protein